MCSDAQMHPIKTGYKNKCCITRGSQGANRCCEDMAPRLACMLCAYSTFDRVT